MAKTYNKEKKPPIYEIAFDGAEYSQADQEFMWQQLVNTLIKLKNNKSVA